MIRDSHTIYVYWEVSHRTRLLASQHFHCDWHMLPKMIRLYNVTNIYFNGHNAHYNTDYTATSEADNWYIHQIEENATYIVDYGIRTWDGQFIPLLRSNPVHTPRAQEASYGEPIIGTISNLQDYPNIRRIPPHFFENFNTYSNLAKRGIPLNAGNHEANKDST